MGKMEFVVACKSIHNNNQIVLLNSDTGSWIKISAECYALLTEAIEKGLTSEKFINIFEAKEDKLYIKKMLTNLFDAKILSDSSQQQELITLDSVDLMITHRCNLFCKHCAVNASNDKQKEFLKTQLIFEILDKVLACHVKRIVLTGGEPLIRDDFIDILNYINNNSSAKIAVMTNGTLISNTIAKALANCSCAIDISIDGINEKTCSLVRGKGTFEKVITGIKILKEHGIKKISLSMVQTQQNIIHVEDFKKLCDELDVSFILRRLSIVGRAQKYRDLLEIKRTSIDYIESDCSIDFDIEYKHIHEIRKIVKPCICKAGKSTISIDGKGNIFPCSTLDLEATQLGNIFEISDLKKFLQNDLENKNVGMNKFLEYSPYGNTLCNECNLRFFCWTCPYMAYDYKKDIQLFKERCHERKVFLNKMLWSS